MTGICTEKTPGIQPACPYPGLVPGNLPQGFYEEEPDYPERDEGREPEGDVDAEAVDDHDDPEE
jgi:hypothetical protein